ncbi:MAG: sodium:solute symporter family protein [Candidatus Methylomirabilia bacterium]
MGLIDVLIVLAFIIYAISSGFRNKGQASKNLHEYFLAGRSLPGWKAGLSMAATQFAADTPLLVTGLIATAGIFALWQLWIFALAFLLMGFVLASSWRRAGVLTDAELTEVRYGRASAAVLRGVKAIYFGTIFNCTVLAWVLFAAAKIAEPFLLWDLWLPPSVFQPVLHFVQWVGVPLTVGAPDDPGVWINTANNFISIIMIVTVTTFYSATGGLRSVVATDVVQITIMLLGTLAFTIIVVNEVGGLTAIRDQIYEKFASGGPGGILPDQILAFTPDRAKHLSLALLFLFALQWIINLNSDGTGYLAQRSMACRSEKDAKIAAIVFTFAQVLFRSLLWLPLGLGLLILFPPDPHLAQEFMQADREATYVRGMAELLPPGVMGLMLTAMLAALASTVDTHLNWGSSYWTNDIYKRFICQAWLKTEPSDRSVVWVARGANMLILIIALVIMTQLTSINEAWQMSLLLGAGMGVGLILRWLWWRMNAWAEITAILVSLIIAPILIVYVDDQHQALRLLIMAVVSTIAALVAIRAAGPEDRDRLIAFYRKVNPVGFWGPIAKAAGVRDDEGPRRLWRSVGAMMTCGLSVFCLLVGIGTWLTGSPAPSWFPWQTLWIIVLILSGLAFCPLWYWLGFKERKVTF